MHTNDIRQAWLDEPLAEVEVAEDLLPNSLRGRGLHLVLRELSAEDASDTIDTCTDKSGKLNQKMFMALVLVKSLRNGDEPGKPLIWDETFIHPLLSRSLKPILRIATRAIELSGLTDQISQDQKK